MRAGKKVLATVAALGAAVGVMGVATGASAAPPTITAGAGSTVTCDFTSKISLVDEHGNPATLKNDWAASSHNADPGYNAKTATSGDSKITAAVAAIPDTRFSPDGPITTNSKGKTTSCDPSSVATDGVNHATITGASIVTTSTSGAAAGTPATCASISGGGSGGTFSSTIDWKATGAKITPTTITGATVGAYINPVSGDAGFTITGGTATGSFAGATGQTIAYLDAKTGPAIIAALIGPSVSSANAASIKTLNPCEPVLKVKVAKGGTPAETATATITGGKGIKKIGLGPAGVTFLGGPGDGAPSTLTLTVAPPSA